MQLATIEYETFVSASSWRCTDSGSILALTLSQNAADMWRLRKKTIRVVGRPNRMLSWSGNWSKFSQTELRMHSKHELTPGIVNLACQLIPAILFSEKNPVNLFVKLSSTLFCTFYIPDKCNWRVTCMTANEISGCSWRSRCDGRWAGTALSGWEHW